MSAPTDPPDTADEPAAQPDSPRLSRRGFLGLGGGLAVGLAAATGFGVGRATAPDAAATTSGSPGTYPFTGVHQAGIVTPAQDRLYLAAFDLTTTSRDELIALLRTWTTIAARLTQGLSAGPFGPASGPYDAPPDDTGEAADLLPAGLTITFGFGRSMFVGTPGVDGTPGADRFGLADKLPEGLVDLPHFAADDLDPARSDGDIVVQACADDPQIAVHAIRNLSRAAFGTATIRWTQLGYGRTSSTSTAQLTPRNLFGFKDGTANVKAEETADLEEHVWVPADALTPADAVARRRLVPRRPTHPHAHRDVGPHVARESRRASSGGPRAPALRCPAAPSSPSPTSRPKGGDGKPLIAVDSHVRLAHPSENKGVRMLRRGYNFTDGNDSLGRLDAGPVLPRVRHGPAHALHPDAGGALEPRRPDGVPHAHGVRALRGAARAARRIARPRHRRHARDHRRQPVRRPGAVRVTWGCAAVLCRA